MGWNGKTDVISILVSLIGFPLIVVLVGIVVSMFINVKYGSLYAIVTIIVLLVLICSGIYVFKRRKQRGGK